MTTHQKNGVGLSPESDGEAGFTLIETVVALIVIMIALLGVFTVFTYAIVYNAGNKARAGALTVLQQEAEFYRAAKFNGSPTTDAFTPGSPDDGRRDLTGGQKAARTVTTTDGLSFLVNIAVDNEPFVAGIQDETYQCLSPQGDAIPCTLKEITVEVRLAAPNPGWQTAIPVTAVVRRTRGN